jgi:hypothetical protein
MNELLARHNGRIDEEIMLAIACDHGEKGSEG